MKLFGSFIYFFKSWTFGACLYGFFINTFSPILLLDNYLVLPIYYILRTIQPTFLLEPIRLLNLMEKSSLPVY